MIKYLIYDYNMDQEVVFLEKKITRSMRRVYVYPIYLYLSTTKLSQNNLKATKHESLWEFPQTCHHLSHEQ